jgi:uncharacterized protein YbbC (DUF1343 family)
MTKSGILFIFAILLTGNHVNASTHPLEEQIQGLVQALEGKRVGLLTNPTAVDSQFRYLSDRLNENPDVNLTCFFAPEHGLRGDAQAGGGDVDYIDQVTGLPVYSLYGTRLSPTEQQLNQIDVLVYDIQDVGTRFYTYVWSMTYAMEACAQFNTEFVVMDRPNPIGTKIVEGPPNTFENSLIGRIWPNQPFGLPSRHGMTAGEIATMVNEEWFSPKVNLNVIKVPGYNRSMSFEETGYPWVIPSPNMPFYPTALVYPGAGLFEGLNLSEGRGTTRPFEFLGAPFVNGIAWAEELNQLNLPGVRFRSAWFTPIFDDHAGIQCSGVQIHVTDPEIFMPVRTSLYMIKTCLNQHPAETRITNWTSRLLGVPNFHERIQSESVEEIEAGWQDNLEAFRVLRMKHFLYPEVESKTVTVSQ